MLGRRLIAIIMSITLFSSWFGSRTLAADSAPTWRAGPFSIETKYRRIGAGGFPNSTSNPFRRMTISDYQVTYRDRTVAVGSGADRTSLFMDARILVGAPRPAILAFGDDAWLITEEGGNLGTERVAAGGGDIPQWQWLDGKNGQPTGAAFVSLRDSSAEPRELDGGKLLILNQSVVLDVVTLEHNRLDVSASEIVDRIGGFNAGRSDVRGVSPARSQVVFVGSRTIDAIFEYALVVVDWRSGEAYGLPFDSNRSRFESVHDATPEWLGHYFEWTRDRTGKERLMPRAGVAPKPWLGRISRSGQDVERSEFNLRPVRIEMIGVLQAFIEREFRGGVVEDPSGLRPGPERRSYNIDGKLVNLSYAERDQKVGLYVATQASGFPVAGSGAIVERIAERFNAELAAGKHQALFTTFKDHR